LTLLIFNLLLRNSKCFLLSALRSFRMMMRMMITRNLRSTLKIDSIFKMQVAGLRFRREIRLKYGRVN
jgi:hypothetical protein